MHSLVLRFSYDSFCDVRLHLFAMSPRYASRAGWLRRVSGRAIDGRGHCHNTLLFITYRTKAYSTATKLFERDVHCDQVYTALRPSQCLKQVNLPRRPLATTRAYLGWWPVSGRNDQIKYITTSTLSSCRSPPRPTDHPTAPSAPCAPSAWARGSCGGHRRHTSSSRPRSSSSP